MKSFLRTLARQRWDDHRYYHQSRINQSLHLFSAISFLCAYVLLFVDPVAAALIGWLVSMTSRQVGHFFFEPKGYDAVNHATHEHKESIKVGYNLHRKAVLLTIWALIPLVLYGIPDFFGAFEPATSLAQFVRQVGMVWLVLGAAGLLFRVLHLFYLQGIEAGLAWMTKILTDPFHDIRMYHRAPLYLMRGQLIDPMTHAMPGAAAHAPSSDQRA